MIEWIYYRSNLPLFIFSVYWLQVIDETLSPTWDEMLIFNEVVMYGNMEEIKDEPPTIVIEIFDQDRVVSFVYGELVSNLEVNEFFLK